MPDWKAEIQKQLTALPLSPMREAEIVEELAQHLEDRYHELLTGGASEEVARRVVVAELNESPKLRQELRRLERMASEEPIVFGMNRRTNMLADLWQDLRYGVRMLRKTPGFTLLAVISLALGIGANTALFSVIDALLLKRLPVKDPAALVLFRSVAPRGFSPGMYNGSSTTDPQSGERTMTSFAYQSFQRLREQQNAEGGFAEIFAYGSVGLTANANGEADTVSGQVVSGNYYKGLGVEALVGRTLGDEDDQPSASPVAVLSYRYWQRRFNGDSAVIGKPLNLNNLPFTIVGVTPQGFEGTAEAGSTQDVTIAIAWEPQLYLERNRSQLTLDIWWLRVMGRLKPGVTREAAHARLENAFQQSVIEHRAARQARAQATGGNPISNLDPQLLPRLYLDPGGQGEMGTRRYYAPSLYMLLGVVGLVLLIACANVANLLLARAAARQKEIGVRLALGAGRFRLMRQLLTESVLLAGLGGFVGIGFAIWLKDGLLAVSDWGERSMRALEPQLDWRVLGFTLGLSLLTGLVFGLAPAWRSTKLDLTPALKDSGRSSSAGSRSRLSRGLIILQVALSLVLLAGAGLFLRTLANLQQVEAGFNQHNLLLFGITPGFIGYKDERLAQLYQQLAGRFESVPGVEAVTFSTNTLLANGSSSRNVFLREALAAPPDAEGRITPNGTGYVNHVRENFLEAMGIPLLAGRGLQPQDRANAPKVVVVNQTFANTYFPGEDPIGKRFTFDPKKPDEIEIVGLARDAKYMRQRDAIPPTAYIPWQQEIGWMIGVTVEVRTAGEPTALVAPIREALREVEPNLPLNNIRTQVEQADRTLALERLLAKLVTLFALLAQLLAAIGLFGILAYAVSQRTREIGIRLALGANQRNVLSMILRQGLLLALAGVGVGLAVAYGLTKFLETQIDFKSLLYGVQINDALTYAVTSTVLLLVALVACVVPARRAARVDPLTALRHE